jgi:C4-dicarboxylate-specific signal transduction histidine kinase
MATGVAHELNQPLNIISMAAGNVERTLKRGEFGPEYQLVKM